MPSRAGGSTLSSVRRRTLVRDRETACRLAAEAYVYLYPLVLMDATRRQMAPANVFAHRRRYPAPDADGVQPSFDSVCSSAWLDVTEEPVIVSVPDAGDRYYLLPMFDMWSDLFASPGTRTSGNWPAHFGVVARGFEGKLPPGVRRLEAPTPYAWIAGRTQCESERKFAYANAFQKRLLLTPLSQWGRAPGRAPARGAPVDQVPARERVDAMCAPEFFAGAAELVKLHPAHAHDQDMLLRMERVGFVAGESFDVDALPRAVADCLHSARAEAQLELHRRAQALGHRSKGWLVATEAHGACGTDFLRRAAMTRIALGAPASEDVVPATARVDGSGRVLRGTNGYLLRFERHELPPVRGFWSLTLYDEHGRPVPNELDRHSLCDGLERGEDGSLELTIQQSPPRKAPVSNWLPSPPARFTLCLRLYWPQTEVLDGTWTPPPVRRTGGTAV
jgi:hypothetical protein